MRINPRFIALTICLLTGWLRLSAYDIPGFPPDEIRLYKQTTNSSGSPVELNLHIFNPSGHRANDSRPAIIFFFGGGWTSGSPGQFHPHCDYLASRGMVAISAEYRVSGTHGTSPQECVKDGKSAIRWVRQNAASLGIDPNRIAAGGGSAGGHVAAAAATLSAYEEDGENPAISSKPNALVLYNPVYDNGPTGYGHSRVIDYWEDFSPLHNIDSTIPPAIVFLGTNDSLVPVSTAESFQSLMRASGVRSDLHLYHQEPHSFFNFDIPDDTRGPYYGYQDTLFKTDQFLTSLAYLAPSDQSTNPVGNWTTIFGNSSFANQTASTNSPVTTDGNGDSIAAGFDEINLKDGGFLRITGSVTFDVELAGSAFKLGLFKTTQAITAGLGTGYEGIWAAAPAITAGEIAFGNGNGTSHPFESAHATVLAPIPGTSEPVPPGSPLNFTLMIARNGTKADLFAEFSNGNSYRQAQNILNQDFNSLSFNSLAFLMTDTLNATEAIFSELTLTTGWTGRPPQAGPPVRTITYLDAVAGPDGNTFQTGSPSDDLTWLVNPGTSGANQTQWGLRPFGNGSTLFQGLHSLPDTLPQITTRINGLENGTYEIWSFYWDQVVDDSQNWTLSSGLISDHLASYSSPGEPNVSNATSDQVTNANDLQFSTDVLTIDGNGLRNLFGVCLGQVTVADEAFIDVFTDNLVGNGSLNRTWFDGVGYARVNTYQTWLSNFDLGLSTALFDDPDGDGWPNGLENLFGTHPGVANPAAFEITSAGSQNQISFVHPKNPDAAEDLTIQYQWSDNLSTFHLTGITNRQGVRVDFATQQDTPGRVTVTATVVGPVIPDALFIRLAVTQAEP